MTTANYKEIEFLASEALKYISELQGKCETFQVDSDNYTAIIEYEAVRCYDPGSWYNPPTWWVKGEQIYIEGVYDENGEYDDEAVRMLSKMIN